MLPDRAFFDRLADAAKVETLPRFRMGILVTNKLDGGFDPVTEGDRGAETAIRNLIETTFPDHGILGEEHGDMGLDRDYVWVIDPIDGTRAFISGVPVWGTLIGLYHKGRAIMSMIDQPFTGERYFADASGSYYRGRMARRKTRPAIVGLSRTRSCFRHHRIFSKAMTSRCMKRWNGRSACFAMAAIAMPMRFLPQAILISSSRRN